MFLHHQGMLSFALPCLVPKYPLVPSDLHLVFSSLLVLSLILLSPLVSTCLALIKKIYIYISCLISPLQFYFLGMFSEEISFLVF